MPIRCGVATGSTLVEAYHAALRCDPVSAFGGIVATNRKLDADSSRAPLSDVFTEVIVAPDADDDAIAIIAAKVSGSCSQAVYPILVHMALSSKLLPAAS